MTADRVGRWLTASLLVVVAVTPIVGNELRVQDVDPVFMRNLVERAAELGGSYYENSIHNRGTLEPLLYDMAGRLVPYDAYWFFISAVVAAFAAVLAWAGARTARVAGASGPVALAAAAATYVFFTVADVGYARSLFVRNITTALLAGVWLLALAEPAWSTPRRARRAAVAVGVLLGLAAQTLLTTVFTGAVVGLVALWLLRERRPDEVGGHLVASAVAAAGAFAVTPVWYIARGSFAEYWSGWWTYARYMSDGPGRSLGSQLALGWDRFYEFHERNPLLVALLLAFALTTWVLWQELTPTLRAIHVGLGAWWLAGWIELVLSQRYSSHYYIVTALPTALMAAALAGHAGRAIADRRPDHRAAVAVPAVVTVLAIFLTDPSTFRESIDLTREFRGVHSWVDEREDQLGGGDRSVRAVLDLVSEEQSGLLAWTFDPFVYLKHHRIPATRFQWKSFMIGEIYLGRTSEDYVLPQTWRWFEEDVAETDPVAFVETQSFDSGTPFEHLVRESFTPVYPGNGGVVWLRDAVAEELVSRRAREPWRSPEPAAVGAGWTVEGTGARYTSAAQSEAPAGLVIGAGPCVRLEGTMDVPEPGALPSVRFRFTDPDDLDAEPQYLSLEGARAGSGSQGLGPTGFEALDVTLPGDAPVDFTLLVGERSAALVVAGQLRAAVRLPDGLMRVALETSSNGLELADLRTGPAPTSGGCG